MLTHILDWIIPSRRTLAAYRRVEAAFIARARPLHREVARISALQWLGTQVSRVHAMRDAQIAAGDMPRSMIRDHHFNALVGIGHQFARRIYAINSHFPEFPPLSPSREAKL